MAPGQWCGACAAVRGRAAGWRPAAAHLVLELTLLLLPPLTPHVRGSNQGRQAGAAGTAEAAGADAGSEPRPTGSKVAGDVKAAPKAKAAPAGDGRVPAADDASNRCLTMMMAGCAAKAARMHAWAGMPLVCGRRCWAVVVAGSVCRLCREGGATPRRRHCATSRAARFTLSDTYICATSYAPPGQWADPHAIAMTTHCGL